MSRRRVVITGLGPLAAIGEGLEDFTKALRLGHGGIKRLSAFDADAFHARNAAELPGFDPAKYFPPHRLKRLDRYAQFALASAKLALQDAGLEASPEDPTHRAGVSFGTALGGISNAEHQHAVFMQKGLRGVTRSLALQVFGGSAHSNIAIEFGFRGPGTTNSNSCASGTMSVGEALRFIQQDLADVVVAGGAEAPLSPLTYAAFDIIHTMSPNPDPEKAYRPFDRHRNGFVMGEGAASLILEEWEHARARGAKIYGEVLGYAFNNDAYHMTSPLPSCESVIRCMRLALRDAALEPDQIDHINAHASSTQLNDAGETKAIKTVFGPCATKIPVTGTKPFTGHPLGATGAMEAIICALTLRDGFIPPTLNYDEPDCDLDIVHGNGRAQSVRYILSNSFGFGGINACLVLGPPPQSPHGS